MTILRPRRPRLTRGRSRAAASVAILLIGLVAVLAACSSGGSGAPADPAAANDRLSAAGADLGSKGDAQGAVPSSAPAGGENAQYASVEQRIVKTGEVTLQVTDVTLATSKVRALVLQLGGYVGGVQAGTRDEAATLTLRIPAARFDDALSGLHDIGDKVLVEATREEDVTSAVVDLEARLKNLQTSEAQYRSLMAKATKIEDILSVQSRLDDVQGQIEQLSAQLKQLSNQADLSTLTVTLQPQPEPIQVASSGWDPGETFSTAVGALLSLGQGLATAGIWLAIVGLPLLVVLAILAAVLVRLGLFRRPAAPPSVPTPEA